jgi:hypothetical protein
LVVTRRCVVRDGDDELEVIVERSAGLDVHKDDTHDEVELTRCGGHGLLCG